MERARLLIKNLKKFHKWDELAKKSTQEAGKMTEEFVEYTLEALYDNAKVYKTGSQSHPDFLIVPKKQKIIKS